MASFWGKVGIGATGLVEGLFTGGFKGLGVGGLIGAVAGIALGLWASSVLLGIAAVICLAPAGAFVLAPLTAAYGGATKPFQRVEEANQRDLAAHQAEFVGAQMDLQQAEARAQDTIARAKNGYLSSGTAQSGVPLNKTYEFNNPDAKGGHLERAQQQKALGMGDFVGVGAGGRS